MWTLITGRTRQFDAKIPGYRPVKRSFPDAPARHPRAPASLIELPQALWDRIILFMFICCLLTFLHALFGFGVIDEGYPRLPQSASPLWSRGPVAPNNHREMGAQGKTRVMVDWHGNPEYLPSTTSALISPAAIPQDALPDPTSTLLGAEHGRPGREGSHPMTTKVMALVDTPFAFYGRPYDPFRLEFEDFGDASENHGLYPVAGSPRAAPEPARTRRFGRCFPGEACF